MIQEIIDLRYISRMFIMMCINSVTPTGLCHYENRYSPYNGSIIKQQKKDVKNLSKQSDYEFMTIKYQLLNGKAIQKTLTSHDFFNKFIFSFHQKFTGIVYQIT